MSRYKYAKLLRAGVALLAGLALSASASAFTKPPFPRVGGINIGAPFNYNDTAYQAALARQNLTVLGMYPGLAPGGQSMQSIVAAIKAQNPAALVFLYVNANELNYQTGPSAWSAYQNKLDAMKWWLYTDGSMSTKAPSAFGAGYHTINSTPFTPKDANGDDAIDWITRYYVSNYYVPNPAVDGFFMDNTFWQTSVSGDWQRNGQVEPAGNAQASQWLRQGYARYYGLARSLLPNGKFQIGNVTTWGDPNAVLTEYQGLVNGGVLEGFIGKSWSVETWGGWANMMARYQRIMGALTEPKLGIFNQWGDPHDYQAFRYGFASCLMDDGYYSFTDSSAGYHGVVWFDELSVNLGQASAVPTTAAWQNGVWRRDFDNGIALVNPKGNGPRTVTLEADFVKVKGVQDPATNSGQTVRTVTLQDRDGIILLRPNPPKRPNAPKKITVTP